MQAAWVPGVTSKGVSSLHCVATSALAVAQESSSSRRPETSNAIAQHVFSSHNQPLPRGKVVCSIKSSATGRTSPVNAVQSHHSPLSINDSVSHMALVQSMTIPLSIVDYAHLLASRFSSFFWLSSLSKKDGKNNESVFRASVHTPQTPNAHQIRMCVSECVCAISHIIPTENLPVLIASCVANGRLPSQVQAVSHNN